VHIELRYHSDVITENIDEDPRRKARIAPKTGKLLLRHVMAIRFL